MTTLTTDAPLVEMLYTMAENWSRILIGNNCPAVNAVAERARHPRVGDLVFETSHQLGARNADMVATLGVLLAIEKRPLYTPEEWDEAAEGRPCPTEKAYVIRDLTGRRFTWTNASLIALPVCTHESLMVPTGTFGETRSADVQERADSLFVASFHNTRMLSPVRDWLTKPLT